MRIINFHGIGTPERILDPGEPPFWLSRDQYCDVLDRIVALRGSTPFVITFDDSNSSDLSIAVPELLDRGLTATFFVITGRIGLPGSLGASDIDAISRAGMRIGSHGVGHLDLKALPPDALREDVEQSKSVLEDMLGKEVVEFAIPFGRYNAAVLRALDRAGYRRALTSDGGDADGSAFIQPRRSLRGDMSDRQIEEILGGKMPMARRMRRAAAMTFKRLA